MKWVLEHRAFALVILAQIVSLLGLLLVEFGLAIWLYKETASIKVYTLSVIFSVLPGVVVVPFALGLVDRFDRVGLMVTANVLAAGAAVWLLAKVVSGELLPHHVYLVGAVSSVCRSLERVAYLSILTRLLPEDKLRRAGGVVNLVSGVIQAFAPIIATALLSAIGIVSLIGIEIIAFIVAAVIFLKVRATIGAGSTRAPKTVAGGVEDMLTAWRFLNGQSQFGLMLAFYFVFNVLIGVAFLCVTPIMLSLHSERMLSWVLVAAGIGALAGGFVISWRGVPNLLAHGIFMPAILVGMLVFSSGFAVEVSAFCSLTFGVMSVVTLINSSDEYFWLSRAPCEIHGRIFSIREIITSVAFPIGAVLIDLIFGMLPRSGQGGETLTVVDNVSGLRMIFFLAGGALIATGLFALRWIRISGELK